MNQYGVWASRIARWLHSYSEWREQLASMTDAVSGIHYGDRVQGGSGESGGSTAALATRRVELQARCRRVEQLLDSLSPGERIAAQWWIDRGTTQEEIANRLGIHRNTAGPLIRAIPTILALRNMHLMDAG
jgi:DNA-binding CsgD family transcriptional regulator